MGSKFGLILSLPLIFLCFLYGVDFVMIQLTYTSLDAFSTTINYKISKTGEINSSSMWNSYKPSNRNFKEKIFNTNNWNNRTNSVIP